MGRYTGPRTKISRRFGEPLFGPDKVLDRRTNPPGQHGARRRKKLSEYGEQLREKQKARFIYGMMERQFRTFFERAKAKRPAARQLVTHRHVTLDGKICNVPSCIVKPGQVIGLREKSKGLMAVQDSLNKHRVSVTWLEWNPASLTGSLTAVPERSEIPENLNMQAIVELYSR